MGFLNNKEGGATKLGGVYLELSEEPKRFRPLAKSPTSIWIHRINPIKIIGPDAQPKQLRKYATEICVSTGRSGAGCFPCTTPDPMWDKLEQKNKTNKKGARTDFPKSCVHLLPVLDLVTGKVVVMKGGNQLYEDMDKWYDMQDENGKDLRRCEWQAFKTGKDIFTKYNTVRLDATSFQMTPELEAEAAIVLEKAKADMAPLSRDQFMAAVNGDVDPMGPNTNQATVSVPPAGAMGFGIQGAASSLGVVAVGSNVPQQPSIPSTFTFEPKVSPIPITPAPAVQANSALEEFTVWCNQQPEFQGVGTFNNLIPVLQEKIGGVNYHSCTADQLVMLKGALTDKLNAIRFDKKA